MIILLFVAIAFANWFSPKFGGLIVYFSDGTYSHRFIEDIAQPFLDKDFGAIIFILFPFVIVGTCIWMEQPEALVKNPFFKLVLKFYLGLSSVCLLIFSVQWLIAYNPLSDWHHAGLDVVKKGYVLVDKKKEDGDYYVTLKDLKTAAIETHNLGYKCKYFDKTVIGKRYEFDEYIYLEKDSRGNTRVSSTHLNYFEHVMCWGFKID